MNQEKNKPYYAFPQEDVKDGMSVWRIQKGSNITVVLPEDTHQGFGLSKVGCDYMLVPMTEVRTLYDGRYCAVSAFVFAVVDGHYSVLANQRGPGTPDFQGCWNCPCGFLERNEDSRTGAAREIKEETLEIIEPEQLKVVYVETEPEKCNNGNVTIRHLAFIGKQLQINKGRAWTVDNYGGGEKDEVKNVLWIPVDNINLFDWAFHHEETIRSLMPKKWKRRIIELYYRWFK